MAQAPREGRGSGTTSQPTTGAAAALDEYIEVAGLEEPKAALFQTVDPAGRRLTGRALERLAVPLDVVAERDLLDQFSASGCLTRPWAIRYVTVTAVTAKSVVSRGPLKMV